MRTARKGVYCNEGLVPGVLRDGRNRRVIDDRALAWVCDLACLKCCGFGIAELEESIGCIDWKQGYYDSVLSGELPYMSNLIAAD